MWRRNIIYIFVFLSVLIIQTSFGSTGLWENKINLISALIIGCVLYYSLNMGLLFTVIAGLYLDMNSGLNFGLITIALFMAVITIYLLAKHVISYNSIWSILLLIVLGVFFYNLNLLLLSVILKQLKFGIDIFQFNLIDIIWQSFINIVATCFIYSIRNILKRRMIFYEK